MISSLLEAAIHQTGSNGTASGPLDRLLSFRNLEEGLKACFELLDVPKNINRRRLLNILAFCIAEIDEKINTQLNAILHHSDFQRIEASWRGLQLLVNEVGGSENIRIRFLDVKWRELVKDFEKAIEFDQSNLFKKVYNAEYDMSGGEPFGVLLGDYYIPHRPTKDMPYDNLATLTGICTVSSASFSPFVASSHPAFFGVDSFSELSQQLNISQLYQSQEYIKWNQFRESIDSRFVGLTLPRMLMRKPYRQDSFRNDGFRFKEQLSGHRENYLWGNACYALGSVLINAFREHGWFTEIRGANAGLSGGGMVKGMSIDDFATDAPGIARKFSTDIRITDAQERDYSELGLIPMCHRAENQHAVFYSNQSVHGLKHYGSAEARASEKLGSMLQYILCVSRFAHYLKVIGRDKVGALSSAEEVQDQLNNWLMKYSVSSDSPSFEMRAKHPLSESQVSVRTIPGRPGVYGCIVHLKPHAQVDQVMSSIKLVTELAEAKI